MVQCIIFDLSEVLIAGLVGIEKELSRELAVPEQEILPCFLDELFEQLLIGCIPEEVYLAHVIAKGRWPTDVARLKAAIRRNFHNTVEGTIDILTDLVCGYELALLSDHAREWISYIKAVHPFLGMFRRAFFSFDLKGTKDDPATFVRALDAMSISPERCLFIDDNPTNVRVAESVGVPSIRFLNAEQLAADLGARGVEVT
jgi:FMN phosphatase YigB (HAD superfamily)